MFISHGDGLMHRHMVDSTVCQAWLKTVRVDTSCADNAWFHNRPLFKTTSMAAENFVKPKKYIAGISDLAALARHSLGS